MQTYIFFLMLFFTFILFGGIFYKILTSVNLQKNTKKKQKTQYISFAFLFISLVLLLITNFFTDYSKSSKNDISSDKKILFLLDVSKSMKALDYNEGNKTFSRLDTAKKWIADFVLENSASYSLSVFAGDLVGITPLTTNLDTFVTFLGGVDENNVSKQGTNLANAIFQSISRFDPKEEGIKSIYLFSDGGDELEKANFGSIKQELDKQNIKLFIIGVGSKKGNFIPEQTDVFGQTSFKEYKGEKVITKLNVENLENLASKLGASYFEINSYGQKNFEKFGSSSAFSIDLAKNRILSILSYIFFLLFSILFFYNRFLGKKY